jgi:transcription elongation GreA/GreB family factor
MSRAFMKERDDEPEITLGTRQPLNSRPISARGLEELKRQRDEAVDPDERARLEGNIAATQVIGLPHDRNVVAFGATVTLSGASQKKAERFTIVGEDEVDIPNSRIGIESPLAQALLGARVGDVVVWRRPAGNRSVTVESIEYDYLDGTEAAA